MILQVLLGGVAGLALVGKLYWHRLLVMLGVRKESRSGRRGRRARPHRGARRPVNDRTAWTPGIARRRSPRRPRPGRRPEPGSFRDRNGSVFYRDGRVFRGLSARALANWQRLQAAPFSGPAPPAASSTPGRRNDAGDWAGVRRARPRAVRLLSVRVDLRHAEGRGAAASRADAGRARGGHDPEGRLALQRAVAGRAAGLHRHPELRAAEPRRALGRLPPVLRALPLSADAAPTRAWTSAPGCGAASTASRPRRCAG